MGMITEIREGSTIAYTERFYSDGAFESKIVIHIIIPNILSG